MTILQEITAQRQLDVAAAKAAVSASELRERIAAEEARLGPPLDVLRRLNVAAVSEEPSRMMRPVARFVR